jgi:hypothetical protein
MKKVPMRKFQNTNLIVWFGNREAHDIGESLQHKLEEDEQVERCFVHLDFECEHKPEH